jgi:spore germination protein KA
VGVSTVVVVSFTAIASLVIPNLANISILIRLFLAVLASIFGFYGILIGLLLVLAHASSLRSFGVSCSYPIMPMNLKDFKRDVILETPLWERLGQLFRNGGQK